MSYIPKINSDDGKGQVNNLPPAPSLDYSLVSEEKFSAYYIELLKGWKARYDYSLWHKVQDEFNLLWPELRSHIYIGMEYSLYKDVLAIFFEIRNLLQWSGYEKDRIRIANWLLDQSSKRNDIAASYVATSSLVWTFVSDGEFQDLQKALSLWEKLEFYLVHNNFPDEHTTVRHALGDSLYVELITEVLENGIRLAIKNRELKKALKLIILSENKLKKLYCNDLIDSRLKIRLEIIYCHHRAIIHYLSCEFDASEKLFIDNIENAKYIGWNRLVKVSKSWLATIARIKRDYYQVYLVLYDVFNKESSTSTDQLIQQRALRKDRRDVICQMILESVMEEDILSQIELDSAMLGRFLDYMKDRYAQITCYSGSIIHNQMLLEPNQYEKN